MTDGEGMISGPKEEWWAIVVRMSLDSKDVCCYRLLS